MKGKKAGDEMQDATQQLFFTVCPRCNYPGHHPMAAVWGAQGGKAKVKKGFASPAVQAKAQATRAAQREAKAKEKAQEKAQAQNPTAPPPQ